MDLTSYPRHHRVGVRAAYCRTEWNYLSCSGLKGRMLGSRLVHIGGAPANRVVTSGFGSPTLVTTDGQIAQQFPTAEGRPDVSPDGNWVAFYDNNVRPGIWLYRPDSELVREIYKEGVTHLEWAPESSRLFYLVRDGEALRLMAFNVPAGEPAELHPNPGFTRFEWVKRSSELPWASLL